jgi:O-antigen/teichoic acid export membrane protein
VTLYFFIGLIFIVSKDVIRIALGLQWVQYDWILQYIMLCGFGQLIEVVMRSALKAQGKSNLILKLAVFKFLCLGGLLFVLGIHGGVQGVLLATVFTSIISAVAFLFVASASANIKKNNLFKQIYPPIISIVGALFIICLWQGKINNIIQWVGFSDLNGIYYSFVKILVVSVVLLLLYVGVLMVVANGHSREIIYEFGSKIRAKI